MRFVITSDDYVNCLKLAADKIAEKKAYISELDSVTGDGDHWANLNLGFRAILEEADSLRAKDMTALFNRIGAVMMMKTGGSSGILYGGAYLAAGRTAAGKTALSSEALCACLNAMVEDMCKRGNSEPGYKTMIDALYPAVEAYKAALEQGLDDRTCMTLVKQAALEGAQATAAMPAVRGRASYRLDKGVGHLDPGAVTMSYQIECLCEYILGHLL